MIDPTDDFATLPEFEPLQTLEFGRNHAWQMNLPARLAAEGYPPESDATVAQWVIEAPWAHPVWNSYWLLMMHLRPLVRDGKPFEEPKFYLEGATHELQLWALNPDFKAEAIARKCELRKLTPINFASQLILPDDAAATALADQTACDILYARINPDTDFIRQWTARFGDNMMIRGAW